MLNYHLLLVSPILYIISFLQIYLVHTFGTLTFPSFAPPILFFFLLIRGLGSLLPSLPCLTTALSSRSSWKAKFTGRQPFQVDVVEERWSSQLSDLRGRNGVDFLVFRLIWARIVASFEGLVVV